MYLLTYLFVILIFTPFVFEAVKGYSYVMYVKKNSLTFRPNIVTNGRLIKAYTIESRDFLMSQRSYQNGFAGVIIYKLLRVLGLHDKYMKVHLEYLQRLIFADLYNKSNNADYLVNYQEKATIDENGDIFLFASCDTIKMFPETIPLYMFPEESKIHYRLNTVAPLFQVFSPILIAFFFALIAHFSLNLYSMHVAKHFSAEKEALVWSYIEKGVLGKQELGSESLKIQTAITKHLKHITENLPDLKYNYKIHILDTDVDDLDIYPDGNIVITKGMAKNLKKKAQLDFLLLHLIAHCENKDHITNAKGNLLTLSLLTDIFPKNSFIASFFVNPADFESDFSTKEEMRADNWALEKENHLFGGIGGFEVFAQDFYDISKSYNSIFNSHPFSVERTENVRKFASEHSYTELAEVKLDYGIAQEKAAEQTTFAFEVDSTTDYMTIYATYKKEQGEIYRDYQAVLNSLKGIMAFKVVPTHAEIGRRKELLHQGLHDIDDFETRFNKHLKESDDKMQLYFQTKKFDKLRVKINEQLRMWQTELEEMQTLSKFYFNRDKKIISEENLMLNYIGLRHETIKIGPYGVEFASQKEQNDYNIMQKRLEGLIKTPPPTRKQKT